MRPLRCLMFLAAVPLISVGSADDLELTLRYQQETSLNSDRYHQLERQEKWNPEETALIVCDVWDYHHCLNAVRRVGEMGPRLNEVVAKARELGITIIHSPSSCMEAYEDHPARRRAIAAPQSDFLPHDISSWCSIVPSEERAIYPIDQSDGGEDDDPQEHAEWAAKLTAMGRNPRGPWKKQADLIDIDNDKDFITDSGIHVWNILEQQGVKNVILTGVHTNMCVLGRPFGLRQMARNGKNVVLMRDMTDTMYNPARWPYVSHFTGTDLIVSHIERCVCPTITSEQFIGGETFRYKNDKRPHLVMLIAEDEYLTEETLPKFAVSHLGRDFRVTTVFGSDQERNSIPGIEAVNDADVLLVSIRRRVLPSADMKIVRDFVESGKPVIGIRTASHAFSLRNKKPPEGFADWPEFDAQVFGGNYHGHHGNSLKSTVSPEAGDSPVLAGVNASAQGGSLYQTSPLAKGTTVLTTGTIEGLPSEPVSWTFQRQDGGRSFYSSMGHVRDFENSNFTRLLYQGICWAADVSPTEAAVEASHWEVTDVPLSDGNELKAGATQVWYRCAFRFAGDKASALQLTTGSEAISDVWVNGNKLPGPTANGMYTIPSSAINKDDANLLVLRLPTDLQSTFTKAPSIQFRSGGSDDVLKLKGKWQRRAGSNLEFANIPLPAKFGASADIVFTPQEPLWTARPVTQPGEFTAGIEGPACDDDGNIFAVNYQKQGTIGRVSPQGSGEVFVTLPEGSVGNGIRFDYEGNFFVADYPQHNILKVNTTTRKVTKVAHNASMNQPNDLAIAPDGTLYASDPNWANGTGQLWRIDADGTTTLLAKDMGTTNGIEVSPDGSTLYVNESKQRNIWAFDISADKTIANKRLIKQFTDHGFDGMRCDVDGNLYIARYGEGTVIKMTPAGKIMQSVNVLGAKPSNVCFGGKDGRTVYVTEVEGTRLVSFRVDRPGRSWSERQK